MADTSSFSQSGDRLVILLNATFLPPKLFNDTRIKFGTPVAVTAADHNCQVETDAIPGMGYYGSALVYYTRIDLSVLAPQGTTLSVFSTSQFDYPTILGQLNGLYNSFLDPDDVVQDPLPTLQIDQSQTITLKAASGSLGWVGQVDVTLTYGKPKLAAVIVNKALAQQIDYSKLQVTGRDRLWSVDFTSYRDALAIVPTQIGRDGPYANLLADFGALAEVCNQLGVPGFTPPNLENQAGDYATKDVADSNQSFDRVVILPRNLLGNSSPMSGPIYFHYKLFDKV